MQIRFFLLTIFSPLFSVCQKNDVSIVLDTSLKFINPDKFYVCDVIDSRLDKSLNNFRISLPVSKENVNDSLPISKALMAVFNNCLFRDTTLVPVVIDIRQFSIEPRINSGLPKDELKIELMFQTFMDNKNADFAFYSFNQGLYKYMKTSKYLSTLLHNELPLMVKELNRFINNSFSIFPYKGIRIKTSLFNELSASADTLFHQKGKKLTWNDFKGQPDLISKASAETGSGFTYTTFAEIKNGYLNVSVVVKCFFLTQLSWIKPELATEYVLSHEQLHFDINYLGALKFIDSIGKTKFTVSNWQNELATINKEKFRETNSMQKDYDSESNHGRKGRAQLTWQKNIQAMLKENLP